MTLPTELAFDYQDTGTGERGCGRRERGGLYAVTDVGLGGTPWWECLLDPPDPVTDRMMAEWGIAPRDVSLRSYVLDGVTYYFLLDWTGAGSSPTAEGYWNPADQLEEALSGKGWSTRVPTTKIDWSRVTQGETNIWQIHPHAILTNTMVSNSTPTGSLMKNRLWDRYGGGCVTHREDHDDHAHPPVFCDSLWWETVEGGIPLTDNPDDRRVIRQIGSLSYPAWRAPDGFVPQYQAGIYIKRPFHLEIILDPAGGRHETVAGLLEAAGQDYKFVED